jgi:hypothetical protein
MKERMQDKGSPRRSGSSALPGLTVEEHLWLHRRMERRAHELWLARGCQPESALDDWVQAERETWKKFHRIPPHGSGLEASINRKRVL